MIWAFGCQKVSGPAKLIFIDFMPKKAYVNTTLQSFDRKSCFLMEEKVLIYGGKQENCGTSMVHFRKPDTNWFPPKSRSAWQLSLKKILCNQVTYSPVRLHMRRYKCVLILEVKGQPNLNWLGIGWGKPESTLHNFWNLLPRVVVATSIKQKKKRKSWSMAICNVS